MKLLFVGTPEVAATVLEKISSECEIVLVITREDSAQGRRQQLVPSPVALKAQELGLKTLKVNRFSAEVEALIIDSGAQRAVVVAYGALVPRSSLGLFSWWNLHFSLLPLWRGATPLQHSLIKKTGQGITLFELDEGMDTGPIISQLAVPLPDDVPAGDLLLNLASAGTELILDALRSQPSPEEQVGETSLAPKISRAEAKIDFGLSAIEIQRRVFALNPEPMAWTFAGKTEIRILAAKALGNVDWNSLASQSNEPGSIERRKGQVLVYCGHGTLLELLEVQPAGKRPMPAADWARGYSGHSLG